MIEKKGLSLEHNGELNKTGISADRFSELRRIYADNPEALFDIDSYDITSEVGRNLFAFRDALKANDSTLASKIKTWIRNRDPRVEK